MRVQIRAVDFAEPVEDEADNLFSNCLGFTRFLRPEVGELVRLWAATGAAERVSAAA